MPIKVLHLIDSLNSGGAEHMAVILANSLAERGMASFLCATRHEGPLKAEISPEVGYLFLGRKSRFDLSAFTRLCQYIAQNQIDLIHAHGTSVFIAVAVKRKIPSLKVLWHDHYGNFSLQKRSDLVYRPMIQNIDGVIAVNKSLENWTRGLSVIAPERIWRIPNFILVKSPQNKIPLPGEPGFRIIHVANLRWQKDHLTLIQAMCQVVAKVPKSHLILVGAENEKSYSDAVFAQIKNRGISKNVTWLGSRIDIPDLLAGCDIGVISSASEGLPLVLLEYGTAGLPVVCTNVGDCAEVLDNGNTGIVVPSQDPRALAEGLIALLQGPSLRANLGSRFKQRIEKEYNPDAVLSKLESIYLTLMKK